MTFERKIIIGLDVGEKRIGVAWGDNDVKIAVPCGVIEMNDEVVIQIEKMVEKLNVSTIVVGLPRNSSGEETNQSKFVRDFIKRLKNIDTPIVFQDESLTSVQAENLLSNHKRSKKHNINKGEIDEIAASLILQDYLEANFD